tara:strand:+ start:585 stop:1058 length:474 start_codon:yes stop_codon:yes gene_type:complete
MKNFTNFFVSLGFIGYIKVIPGTIGSLISILFLFPIFSYNILSKNLFFLIFISLIFLSYFFIGLYSKNTNTHDSKKIIIDEFIGIFLIFLFYDIILILNDITTLILIFIIFRFFDILKIFPADLIDRKIRNPAGVILDDIVAAIYTIIVLFLFHEII